MQKVLSLNMLHEQYLRGTLERKRFEELLAKFVLENQRRFHLRHWEREEYVDYICWLYPRIRRAIDSYRDTGASFENYISVMVLRSAREYRSRPAVRDSSEYAAWTFKTVESEAHEQEPEYGDENRVLELIIKPPPNTRKAPRQILILLLKSYYFVSDDFLHRVAPLVEMEKEKLMEMMAKLRAMREKQEAAIRGLQERICGQFYRCLAYEERLRAVSDNPIRYADMQRRLERARRRYTLMRQRLSGMRLGATNRQVAEILGISKGTVDSALFLLRKRIEEGKWQPSLVKSEEN
jgi:DNA-directed RNA polymerase specialized sigma24 family protein